jgi:hypothetical protein
MKKPFLFFFVLLTAAVFGQAKMELTPTGFATLSFPKPAKTLEKLIEHSRNWAAFYNRNNDFPYDVYDVTATSLSIDGFVENAFYYRNNGEVFHHRIKYTLKIEFGKDTYDLRFIVREIYADKTLTKTTVADYFTPDGKLKEDFEDVRPSLEKTAAEVVRSFANAIITN